MYIIYEQINTMRRLSMKPILFLLPFLFAFTLMEPQEGRVRTVFTGKIERWEVTLGNAEGVFEGYMKNDPNRWTFTVGDLEGEVNTEFNDKYGSWVITSGTKTYYLKTWVSGSWNRWELSGGELKEKVSVRTATTHSWDNWQMRRSDSDPGTELDMTTYYNNSWDDWNITGTLANATDGEKITAVFIPIFVSRLYNRKIVH